MEALRAEVQTLCDKSQFRGAIKTVRKSDDVSTITEQFANSIQEAITSATKKITAAPTVAETAPSTAKLLSVAPST